jgi:hypothetical protein
MVSIRCVATEHSYQFRRPEGLKVTRQDRLTMGETLQRAGMPTGWIPREDPVVKGFNPSPRIAL